MSKTGRRRPEQTPASVSSQVYNTYQKRTVRTYARKCACVYDTWNVTNKSNIQGIATYNTYCVRT